MKVLVTGAKGFIGRNLCESLKCIRDEKDRRTRYEFLLPLEVFEYDRSSSPEDLERFCTEADFVFNLAGANRPKDPAEFMKGNFGFASELLSMLERFGNRCPVMLASSAQASLEGRYAGSEYGKSKLAGEELFSEYSERTGAPVLIYRFPNVYGKWCRPNYNSAVATFCFNIAHDLPVHINNPTIEVELLHVDDLVAEMLEALLGNESHGENGFCHAGPTDRVTLEGIVALLQSFEASRRTLEVPDEAENTFSKKLHATYLSYLDPLALSYPLKPNRDERGSFIEFLRTPDRGQISVNVSGPQVTKGNHWHHAKWEKFLVVSGEALIRLRKVGVNEDGNPFSVVEYRVSDENPVVVEMAPGYTHSIKNLSEDHDLVTLMWVNESFDSENPDTYYEEV